MLPLDFVSRGVLLVGGLKLALVRSIYTRGTGNTPHLEIQMLNT